MVSSTPSRVSVDAYPIAVPAAVGAASAVVIVASLLVAFRLDFASDLPTLLTVNGPRVLFAAAAGGLLALAGTLRLEAGRERPLRELEVLALATGAVGGGTWLLSRLDGAAWAFPLGAVAGAAIFFAAVRLLQRPRRFTNLGVAAVLGTAAVTATVFGIDSALARGDWVAGAIAWLLGALVGASFASGAVLLLVLAALLVAALRVGRAASWVAPLAFGLGVGAAGPLVFVGSFAPRAVRALAGGAQRSALVGASAAAGAAAVVAIDTASRLLLGGFGVAFNLAATLLAVPIFLSWNRRRLRREVGGAPLAFEIVEIAVIVVGSLLAAIFLGVLTFTVHGST